MKQCRDCKWNHYCDVYFQVYMGGMYSDGKATACPKRKTYHRKWWKFGRPK